MMISPSTGEIIGKPILMNAGKTFELKSSADTVYWIVKQ
jgi:hypothetical protein